MTSRRDLDGMRGVTEEDGAVFVRMPLDGVRPEDVVIDATPRLLTVEAKVAGCDEAGGEGRFARSFRLPEGVDAGGAVAIMSDGVLTVRLPKRRRERGDTFAA